MGHGETLQCDTLYSNQIILQFWKKRPVNFDIDLGPLFGFTSVYFHPNFMINVMTLIFDLVNSPFLDGDVPRRPSYGVYISQLIRFARVCSHVDDFNTRNKCLTA